VRTTGSETPSTGTIHVPADSYVQVPSKLLYVFQTVSV